MFLKLNRERMYLVHRPNCIRWHWVGSSKPTKIKQASAQDYLLHKARRQLLWQKTFGATANATMILILNSYYNFFLIYNQRKEIKTCISFASIKIYISLQSPSQPIHSHLLPPPAKFQYRIMKHYIHIDNILVLLILTSVWKTVHY